MKTKKNQKLFYRAIILILLIALAILAYILFFILPKGVGVIDSKPTTSGKIKFLFSIYGPGGGKRPYFNKPLAVATDKDKNIYVSDTGNNRICVFDSNGTFLFEFGGRGVAHPEPGLKANWKPGKFNFPYGIDVDSETGNIFVADMHNKRVQVFDAGGNFVDWFPKGPYGGVAPDIYPTDLAVEKGKVYLCNPYQVVIFDTEGKFVRDFGMPGTANGQFDRPNGIDVGSDGTIYVSDCNNLRLQAFTPEGKHKWTIGKKAGIEMKQGREFGLPRNIAVGPDGNVYLSDAFHFQIKVFSPTGQKLAQMGKRGTEGGTFNYPNGIEVTHDKTVYVADKENNRVQAILLDGFVIEK